MKSTWALGQSKHYGTWALEAVRHSNGTWELRHSRHLGTQVFKTLGHLGTQVLGTWEFEGHLGTRSLRHSGTWAREALEALYLANSPLNLDFVNSFAVKIVQYFRKCLITLPNNFYQFSIFKKNPIIVMVTVDLSYNH